MSKQKMLILSFSSGIAGFILNGLAWSILQHPLSSMALVAGMILMFAAFVLFINACFKK